MEWVGDNTEASNVCPPHLHRGLPVPRPPPPGPGAPTNHVAHPGKPARVTECQLDPTVQLQQQLPVLGWPGAVIHRAPVHKGRGRGLSTIKPSAQGKDACRGTFRGSSTPTCNALLRRLPPPWHQSCLAHQGPTAQAQLGRDSVACQDCPRLCVAQGLAVSHSQCTSRSAIPPHPPKCISSAGEWVPSSSHRCLPRRLAASTVRPSKPA